MDRFETFKLLLAEQAFNKNSDEKRVEDFGNTIIQFKELTDEMCQEFVMNHGIASIYAEFNSNSGKGRGPTQGEADEFFKRIAKIWKIVWEGDGLPDGGATAEKILNEILSPEYAPPLYPIEHFYILQHFYVIYSCYEFLENHLQELANIDPIFLMRLNFATMRLGMVTIGKSKEICIDLPERKRTGASTKTKEIKAEAALQETIEAYNNLSSTVKRWDSFSKSLKAKYVHDYLSEEKGVHRQVATIRKDILRAENEGSL